MTEQFNILQTKKESDTDKVRSLQVQITSLTTQVDSLKKQESDRKSKEMADRLTAQFKTNLEKKVKSDMKSIMDKLGEDFNFGHNF